MIGIIGDMHFKDKLGYSEYILDGRDQEKKDILDFIVKTFSDCETIVFLGDQFNSKNNSSQVIKEFVQFVGRFSDKKVIMLAGNHEKKADGTSALDFMQKIETKHNWKIVTNKYTELNVNGKRLHFLPYFHNAELGVSDNKKATEAITNMLTTSDVLFLHHAISSTVTSSGATADLFGEAVLSMPELDKKFKLTVGGHIHHPQKDSINNVIVAGSIFNNEVGETQKFIWKINEESLKVTGIELPGRGIYKLENPTKEDLEKVDTSSIVKVILTKRDKKFSIEDVRKKLERFDASLLVEQYNHQRKKVHFEEGMLEFNVKDLLKTYAKHKKINVKKLLDGFALIND